MLLEITAGGYTFKARYEDEAAPKTVEAFKKHLLGLTSKIIHVRWSGQAGWIPFGDLDLGIKPENGTCYPHPGELVIYPGGVSETELLLAYGYGWQPLRDDHRRQREPCCLGRKVPLGRCPRDFVPRN